MAAGGLLGALAASSCCIVPLVLFGLGISGAWIGSLTRLAPYQPCFIAATLGFLGVGYWLVHQDFETCLCRWRKLRTSIAAPACQSCPCRGDGASPRGARLRLLRAASSQLMNGERSMSRLAIVVLGLGMLASSSAVAAERTITLAVQNMFCADCPFIVKKTLEAVDEPASGQCRRPASDGPSTTAVTKSFHCAFHIGSGSAFGAFCRNRPVAWSGASAAAQ